MFTVDGAVLKVSNLNYESGVDYYDVIVEARDAGTSSRSVERTIRIDITNANDAPECDPDNLVKNARDGTQSGFQVRLQFHSLYQRRLYKKLAVPLPNAHHCNSLPVTRCKTFGVL